ncbi:hypothetical protein G6F57_019332 [Rhizopus arrhizus]|uniref:Tc1-like transposase DDE domain-containing protein n=1 Tax=Rhizopus oryzae TaxID=64495 RepID=A0A9P6WV81_RHIOR|nr:hypothetical protein G6F23_013735 [Rhizopus arrhizus]KAG1424189.1 hypothetical protein G6F58_002500 [Rhizopus delemar]KAG0749846.1 hypothetical protein G6F24_015184 [Rhizopus arrhizus]KAG0776069.1 hypothetical protein G6F21_013749 [Rhizopus arrhizus]KAG0802372.1 hypothetical protein G6F22_000326 [Rhizopus arrhizus]
MKGYFIVMDNAPIHIPQFWAIVKGKVKRNKLTDLESLTTRMIEASEAVPVEHLRAFIQHSVNQFDNCLNKVAI